MNEIDPLNSILREWEAPEPSPGLDVRVRAAWQAAQRPSLWRRMWSVRVTIPAPVLAALLVIAAVLMFQFRSKAPVAGPAVTVPPAEGGYVTRIETAGFKPLPDGAVRVIRSGGYLK